MTNLETLRSITVNDDLAALCSYLEHFPVGTVIDEVEAARVLQLDVSTTVFLLDTLAEAGALLFQPEPPPFAMAA